METQNPTPVRRIVRPPRSQYKVGQEVIGECDFISNARGTVIAAHGAIDLIGPFPEYKNIIAPGVTIRVTKGGGDHEVGDLLDFHDTFVRSAS